MIKTGQNQIVLGDKSWRFLWRMYTSFTMSKIGSLIDVQSSKDPEGLRIFYYLVQVANAHLVLVLLCVFLREVHEEASGAREKVYELKLFRQEKVVACREKLKQAYLRKLLEKLKAASKTH